MDASGPGRNSLYRRIAAEIRGKIESGELAQGAAMQSEKQLAHVHSCGTDTIRDALDVLVNEGWIEKRRGMATRVKVQPVRERMWLNQGSALICRIPTLDEADELDIGYGVPVVVVNGTLYPANQYEFFAGEPES